MKYIQSRIMVVRHEAKEKAISGTLIDLRLTCEYFTGTRALKIKYAITKEP